MIRLVTIAITATLVILIAFRNDLDPRDADAALARVGQPGDAEAEQAAGPTDAPSPGVEPEQPVPEGADSTVAQPADTGSAGPDLEDADDREARIAGVPVARDPVRVATRSGVSRSVLLEDAGGPRAPPAPGFVPRRELDAEEAEQVRVRLDRVMTLVARPR